MRDIEREYEEYMRNFRKKHRLIDIVAWLIGGAVMVNLIRVFFFS